jgi:hypothetical protein
MREQLETEQRLEREQRAERSAYIEPPAIYVVLSGVDRQFYRWVEIGAEEEGVPCRLVLGSAEDLLDQAHTAAQASRVGVSVAIGNGLAILDEAHMPPGRPVLSRNLGGNPMGACRLAGGNAGRLVKRMPLRFEEPAPATAPSAAVPPAAVPAATALSSNVAKTVLGNPDPSALAGMIARTLRQRGLT